MCLDLIVIISELKRALFTKNPEVIKLLVDTLADLVVKEED